MAAYGAATTAFIACREIVSFLPSVVTPLVAKAFGAGGKEAALAPIRESTAIAVLVGALTTAGIVALPGAIMRFILPPGNAALSEATSFLAVKGFTFLPMLIYYVGYASLKGMLDVVTPVKLGVMCRISFFSALKFSW